MASPLLAVVQGLFPRPVSLRIKRYIWDMHGNAPPRDDLCNFSYFKYLLRRVRDGEKSNVQPRSMQVHPSPLQSARGYQGQVLRVKGSLPSASYQVEVWFVTGQSSKLKREIAKCFSPLLFTPGVARSALLSEGAAGLSVCRQVQYCQTAFVSRQPCVSCLMQPCLDILQLALACITCRSLSYPSLLQFS